MEEERFPGLAVLTGNISFSEIFPSVFTEIFSVAALDALVQFRWREEGNVAGFDINLMTGDITINIKLDREKQ